MSRLADYMVQFFADHGIRQVFLVTGGAAMHLNDAIGRNRQIRYTCCHHEQACAMAAKGFFRASGKLAVVQVTGGPGGINALNGVFGAWTDSIPMLVVSGQSKRETLMSSTSLPLRQLGDQEVDIVRMVGGITKYAVQILDPSSIRYHLEKALYLAAHGRPGPVWLDIPIDVQAAHIDPANLEGFNPSVEDQGPVFSAAMEGQIRQLHNRMKNKPYFPDRDLVRRLLAECNEAPPFKELVALVSRKTDKYETDKFYGKKYIRGFDFLL